MTSGPLNNASILIVDDEPLNVILLERILRGAGYSNIRSSSDPLEVEALWREVEPDILLLDVMMPKRDGFGVMEALGADKWAADGIYVPILVLTADISRETRTRALAAGAKDFLNKPFDHDEVRLRINNLLETRALHVALMDTNHSLEEKVAARTEELRASLCELEVAHRDVQTSREETIRRLSAAAEYRDDDTGHHILRMSRYTSLLGKVAGIDADHCAEIELAAQMHDVGKIGIPDNVLQKPGALTPEERTVMERHAEIGHDILKGTTSELLELAATIALTHHERIDGNGYPNGLKGEEIPLEGRLAALADVYDALTNDRVYRAALPLEEALKIMQSGRGTQFDAELFDLFIGNIDLMKEARAGVERKASV